MFKYAKIDGAGYIRCATSSPEEALDFASKGFVELDPSVTISDAPHRLYDPVTKLAGELRPLVRREIPLPEFMARISPQEWLTLEAIADTQTPNGRLVRVFVRQLQAQVDVNLDSLWMVELLPPVVALLWTEGAADARLAEILA